MGNSKPPRKANIDLVDSYARVRDSKVEIVLNEPRFDVPEDATVVLRRPGAKGTPVLATATLESSGAGRRLLVVVPRSDLSDGVWNLRLRADDRVRGIAARLLVQGDRPVVLLWGRQTQPSMRPVPHPRGAAVGSTAERGASRGPGRARALANKALSLLPEERSASVRRAVRRLTPSG